MEATPKPPRRSWKVKAKGYYSEKLMCHFSKIQMAAVINEAESRRVSLVSVIRDALDQRYSLDGERSNSRFTG